MGLFKPIKFSDYYDPEVFWNSIEYARNEGRSLGAKSSDILFAVLVSGGERSRIAQVLGGKLADIGYSGVVNGMNLGDCIRANSGDVLYNMYLDIIKAIDLKDRIGDEATREFLLSIPGVFAIRCNVIYFTRRELFGKLVELADCVGEYRSDSDLDWCSENQFAMHLVSNRLISFNYHSQIDEHYLLGIELGAITIDKECNAENFIPEDLTWTTIRKNKKQMEEAWLKLEEVDTKQSAVEILT